MTTPSALVALAAVLLVGGATCAYAARAARRQPTITAAAGFHAPAPGADATPDGASALSALLAPPGAGGGPGQPGRPTLTSGFHLDVASVELNVLDGHGAHVYGYVRPAVAGLTVALQVLGRHGWRAVARTATGTRGRFRLHFVPAAIGSAPARLRLHTTRPVVVPPGRACIALHCGGALGAAVEMRPQVRRLGPLNVYRLAEASWYGGGGSLACGGYLTSSTMGVANKTLPCGTPVTLRYGGRTVHVRVIDRGPYVAGREFDLTEATKQALGFPGLGVIWSTA
jgi:hypothetical protein